MQQIKAIVFLWFMIMQVLPASAGNSPLLTLNQAPTEINLMPYAQWSYDPTQRWTIHDASETNFQPIENEKIGRYSGNIWIRIPIENTGSEALSLIFSSGDEHAESVELFVIDVESGLIEQQSLSGIAHEFSKRTLHYTEIAFPLSIGAGKRVDIYLRLQSRFNIIFSPKLYDATTFINFDKKHTRIGLLFYGVLFGLLIYNCVFAIYVREREYLYFIAFLANWVVLLASMDGFIYQVWPYGLLGAYPPWLFYSLLGCAFITMGVFTSSYLRLARFHPVLMNFQRVFIAWGALIIVGPIFFSYDLVYKAAIFILLPLTFVNVITGWKVYRSGQPFALEYTLSFGLMLATQFVLTIVDYNGATNYVRMTLLFPALLFSIGIANRISHLKNEYILAR